MTLTTELGEGEYRPDASNPQHPVMALDRKWEHEYVADEQLARREDEVCGGWLVPTACAESILADAPNDSVKGPELDIQLPREVGVREDELLDLRRGIRHARSLVRVQLCTLSGGLGKAI
jgi:hypothetical protein